MSERSVLFLPFCSRAALFLGLFCACTPAWLVQGQQAPPAKPVLELSEDRLVSAAGVQFPLVEPHLAVHPANPNHLVAAAIVVNKNDLSELDCAIFASFDAGQSWLRHDLGLKKCADPWVAILPNGTAVLSVLGPNLLVYRSEDGGRAWTAPPVSLGQGHDHETMVTDSTGGRFGGSLYVVSSNYAKEAGTGKTRTVVFVAKSTDAGQSFAEPLRIFTSNLDSNTMNPVVLSDGTLLVPFSDYMRPGVEKSLWLERARDWALRSSDGGQTFSVPLFISESCEKVFPTLAADASAGPFKDRLYWLCHDQKGTRILLHYSADRGERWSDPIQVNQGSGPKSYVRTPAVAVNKDGVAAIAWYDGRNDRERYNAVYQCQEVYFSASLDGGRTLLPEVKISSGLSCPNSPANGKGGERWPAGGDYFGLVARPDGVFQLLWADSRSSAYQLRTATVRVKATAGQTTSSARVAARK